MTQPQSRTARVISIAVETLMEDHGLTQEQAERRVERTMDVLNGTGKAKLMPSDVCSIREEVAAGWPGAVVARAHGISKETVYGIVNNEHSTGITALPALDETKERAA